MFAPSKRFTSTTLNICVRRSFKINLKKTTDGSVRCKMAKKAPNFKKF